MLERVKKIQYYFMVYPASGTKVWPIVVYTDILKILILPQNEASIKLKHTHTKKTTEKEIFIFVLLNI